MIRRRTLLAATPLALGLDGARAQATSELVFGQSADLSGPLGATMRLVSAGVQLRFDELNASGGVGGRRLRLASHDDRGDPARAITAWRSLARERGVLAFLCCSGSATTAAAEPVLRDTGTPALGGCGVSDSVRQRCAGAAYFPWAPYGAECQALVRHLMTVGATRIGVAYAVGPGGEEQLKLVQQALATQRIEVAVAAGVEPDERDMGEAARKLAGLQPQAIILFLPAGAAADLMKALQNLRPSPRFYALSIVAPDQVVARLGKAAAAGLTLAEPVPYPWHAAEPLTVAYRRLAESANVPVGYASFEGYLNACVLTEALQRCGGEFTHARLHAVLRKMQWRCAGVDLDFGTGGHTGSRTVELVQLGAAGQVIR